MQACSAASPLFGFKARKVTGFTSPEGFLAALNRTNAATRGDGSVDEAVLDGLSLALPAVLGITRTDHVDWPTGRAGELATKLIVLLGDAPDHARDLSRVEQLASQAKDAGITIATVAIDRPGVLSRDESARYQDQWRAIAEGAYRPLDKAANYTRPVEPITSSLKEGALLAERLQQMIDDRVEHARTIAAIASAEAEGKLGEYVNSQGLTLDHRIGWIAETIDHHPMVAVEILMSPAELKTLIAELTQLQQAASGTSRDLSELLQIGNAAATGETSFLAADRGSRTFADHLRRRQGLPPSKPGSLLARSQADLLRSDDLTLAALNARLRASLLQLTRRLQSPDWNNPQRTIDGMGLVPYETIDF